MMNFLAGWGEMSLALTAFFASHVVPARPSVRRALHAHLGGGVYAIAYSAVSLAILAWLIAAAGHAPYIQLWDFELWQLWVPNLVMPLVCLLIAFGIATPNPFSICFGRARTHPSTLRGLASPGSPGTRSSGRSPSGRRRTPSRTAIWLTSCFSACSRYSGLQAWRRLTGEGAPRGAQSSGRSAPRKLRCSLRCGVRRPRPA